MSIICRVSSLALLAACAFAALPARAADIPGAKDPAFLKRFQGSEIIYYEPQTYEALQIGAPDPKNAGNWVMAPAEGQITRIYYHVPSGHSTLEVLRNYEEALKAAGFTQVAERRGNGDADRDFLGLVFHQNWETVNDFNWSGMGRNGIQQVGYVTAQGKAGGAPVKIAVTVANYAHPVDVNYKAKVHFDPDQPLVIVDVVSAKPVANQMVPPASH
jgi:hypothetical protein